MVALSSAEAEYRGIARAINEVLWIRKLQTEIGFPPKEPNKIMCENKAAIHVTPRPGLGRRVTINMVSGTKGKILFICLLKV